MSHSPKQHLPTFGVNHPATIRRRRLLELLTKLAEQGKPMPSNPDLNSVVGWGCDSTISDSLTILAQEGFITIERRLQRRQVTICATGKKTATPDAWIVPAFRPKRPVRVIAAKVLEVCGRPERDVLGRSRFPEHITPRHVIYGLAQREGWGPTHISRVFGVDHSTVLYALRTLPQRLATDPDASRIMRRAVEALPLLPMVEGLQ